MSTLQRRTSVARLLAVGSLLLLSLPPWVSAQAACTSIVPPGPVLGTWFVSGSPYCITGDVQITSLTIEPGVEVLIDGAFQIEVLSDITAIGTAANPISFSARDPAVPWKGLKFSNTPPGSNFTHCIIEHSEDSAISLVNTAPPIIDHVLFRDNSTSTFGGAINADGVSGNFALADSVFSANSSASHGGALRVNMDPGLTFTITNSLFENNTANPARSTGNRVGGALWLESADNTVISNSRFIGNRNNARCTATFNCNVIARGGAIYLGSSGTVSIENNEFVSNQSDALNQGNCFFGGISQSFGAGLYVNSGTVTLANNFFSCNTTTRTNCGPSDGGGGFYVNGGSVTAANNTIARNADATGVALAGGTLEIANSIIYNNNGDGTQVGGRLQSHTPMSRAVMKVKGTSILTRYSRAQDASPATSAFFRSA